MATEVRLPEGAVFPIEIDDNTDAISQEGESTTVKASPTASAKWASLPATIGNEFLKAKSLALELYLFKVEALRVSMSGEYGIRKVASENPIPWLRGSIGCGIIKVDPSWRADSATALSGRFPNSRFGLRTIR
ncbi:MAG: hypothetical protein ABC537_02555 [Candidatus Methanosuratincola sp.]